MVFATFNAAIRYVAMICRFNLVPFALHSSYLPFRNVRLTQEYSSASTFQWKWKGSFPTIDFSKVCALFITWCTHCARFVAEPSMFQLREGQHLLDTWVSNWLEAQPWCCSRFLLPLYPIFAADGMFLSHTTPIEAIAPCDDEVLGLLLAWTPRFHAHSYWGKSLIFTYKQHHSVQATMSSCRCRSLYIWKSKSLPLSTSLDAFNSACTSEENWDFTAASHKKIVIV